MSVCCARPDHPSPCAHTFLFLLSRLLLSRSPVRLPDFRLRLSYVLHHFSFPATTPSFRRLRLRCLPPALPLLLFSRRHPVISTSSPVRPAFFSMSTPFSRKLVFLSFLFSSPDVVIKPELRVVIPRVPANNGIRCDTRVSASLE